MALLGMHGEAMMGEVGADLPRIPYIRNSGALGLAEAALVAPGFNCTHIVDECNWFTNSIITAPSTDYSWFFADIEVSLDTSGTIWSIWQFERSTGTFKWYWLGWDYTVASNTKRRLSLGYLTSGVPNPSGWVTLATGTTDLATSTKYRIAVRMNDSAQPVGGKYYPMEVWIQPHSTPGTWTREINYAGVATAGTVSPPAIERMSRMQYRHGFTPGKGGGPTGFRCRQQNGIYLDESGSGDMAGTDGGGDPSLDSDVWGVAQLMPDGDGAETDWTFSPACAATPQGNARYYALADLNRATNPTGDDYTEALAAAKQNRVTFQDIPVACSAVEAIRVIANPSAGALNYIVTLYDGVGSKVVTMQNMGGGLRHQAQVLTNASGGAWTEALLNGVEIRVESSGTGPWKHYQMIVEALVKDVSANPAAIAEPTCPPASGGRRPVLMVT